MVTHDLRDGAYVQTGVVRGVEPVMAPVALTLDVPSLVPPQLL